MAHRVAFVQATGHAIARLLTAMEMQRALFFVWRCSSFEVGSSSWDWDLAPRSSGWSNSVSAGGWRAK